MWKEVVLRSSPIQRLTASGELPKTSSAHGREGSTSARRTPSCSVRLLFWFCRHTGGLWAVACRRLCLGCLLLRQVAVLVLQERAHTRGLWAVRYRRLYVGCLLLI